VAAGGTLGALFVAGLLGGLGHCLGMCGPLVALAGIRLREQRTARSLSGRATGEQAPAVRPATRRAVPHFLVVPTLIYHAARVAVYAALGAVVGAAGSLLGLATRVTTLGAVVGIVLGLAVLAMGLGYAGLLPGIARERATRWWGRTAGWALRRPGLSGAALLGALNGLLPCGLVYGALLVAASTGSAGGGALCMLVFGVATFPALAIVQTGVGSLDPTRRLWLMRAAGVVVVLIGIQLCLRGLATLGVAPSVHLGGLMLW
jgi:sulfite exporter TauE/SafE